MKNDEYTRTPKRKVSLPADTHERLPRDTAHALEIKLLDHGAQFLLLKARLAQLPRHPSQILQVDVSLPAFVEELEGPQDFVARVALQDLQRRHGLEGR